MSAFEFVSVSVAIVLALTLGKLMTAVNEVFEPKRRDLLHLTYYLLSYVAVMTMWWAQWMMLELESWNFVDFLLVMASPISQYFTVHFLLSPNPTEVNDWNEHFQKNGVWYFSAFLAQIILVTLRRYLIAGDSSITLLALLLFSAAIAVWAIVSRGRAAKTTLAITWAISLGYSTVDQFSIDR